LIAVKVRPPPPALFWYRDTKLGGAMFDREIARMLDREHRDYLDLLGRVEQSLARSTRFPPEPQLAGLARTLVRGLEDDVERHFRFEEEALFPRLADAGEGDIAELLAEEHATIRAAVADLRPLLLAAADESLDAGRYTALRTVALEFVERQVAHIQKETMALLPMLDTVLDADTDRELAMTYGAG
jgi:hemerythrin-like domain-containing protein